MLCLLEFCPQHVRVSLKERGMEKSLKIMTILASKGDLLEGPLGLPLNVYKVDRVEVIGRVHYHVHDARSVPIWLDSF